MSPFEVVSMSLRQKYLRLLSEIMPAGLVGLTLLLGSTVRVEAAQHPEAAQPPLSDPSTVSERLAAIRHAVSDVARTAVQLREGEQLAWGNWWRNGGWRNGGWRNGGWRNGGWGNWRNGWHNGWPNWWHNW
jgi:rSAM-associated Gly-rich repeat protein